MREELTTKGLIRTLQDLRKGLDIEEIATLFPRVRGLTGLLNLTGKEAAKVDEIFRSVASAGVSDLDQAFEDIQTPGFKMRQAMAQLGVVAILLGDVIVPMLVKALPPLVRFIAKGAEVFGNLPGPVQKVIVIFFALLAALGPILIVVGSLISAVGAIAAAFGVTVGTILLFASGIGFVIAAIVLIVIAIFFLVKNWDSVKAFLLSIGQTIIDFFVKTLPRKFTEFKDMVTGIFGDFATAVKDKIVGGFNAAKDFILGWMTTLGDGISTGFNAVKVTVGGALAEFATLVKDGILSGFNAALDFITKWGGKFLEMVRSELSNTMAQIRLFVQNFAATFMFYFNIVAAIAKTAFAVVSAIFTFWLGVVTTIITTALTVIVALWNWGFNLAVTTITFYLNLIVARVQFFWGVFKFIFMFALALVTAIITAAFILYFSIFQGGFMLILSIVKFVWTLLVLAFTIAFLVISTAVGVWWAIISQLFKSGMKVIWAVIKLVWAIIKNVFVIVLAVILGVITTFLALIRGDWGAAWDAINLMLKTVWEAIKEIVFAGLELVQTFLSEAWATIKTVATEAWNGIKDVVLGSLEAVRDQGETIINAFVGIVETGLNAVVGFIDAFTGGINKISGVLGKIGLDIPEIPEIGNVTLPRVDKGGDIVRSGVAIIHRGERVIPAKVARRTATVNGGQAIELTLNFNAPVTADDGDAIAETVKDVLRQHVLRFGGAS